MSTFATTAATNTDMNDLREGHSVIIAARWMLVAAGLVFVLYRPGSTLELSVGVLAVLGIAVTNFFLQTRPLTNRPVRPEWAYWASAADLMVIGGLVLLQGTLAAKAYAFLYPAILAYSLVFPTVVTLILTSGVLWFVLLVGLDEPLDERVLVALVLTLVATAFIGWWYRKVEQRRRERRAEVANARAPFGSESRRIEAQEDLFYGQIVCMSARWFLIVGALFLTIYRATSVAEMQMGLIPLLIIIGGNFFLQARYMMKLPANALLLQVASVVDLGVISVIVISGNPEFFVFYYPVALAFALVFVRRLTLVFTGALGVTYVLLSVLVPPGVQFDGDEETLAIRLVTLLGTALLGTMYWRIQRSRRPREVT
jgi:hypothetical protein